MSDRPIIFSGPMVRALLEGRKTQTRRVLKPQPAPGSYRLSMYDPKGFAAFGHDASAFKEKVRLPYAPGDRLYVREAIDKVSVPGSVDYRADYEAAFGDGRGLGWHPSIHMPRWASRLTLTVTEVRVQRLQDISEADAFAEGCVRWGMDSPQGSVHYTVVEDFKRLWNSLHGTEAWDANPWVVALTFTVERRNIDAGGV